MTNQQPQSNIIPRVWITVVNTRTGRADVVLLRPKSMDIVDVIAEMKSQLGDHFAITEVAFIMRP